MSSSSVRPCVIVGYGLFRSGLTVYSSLRDDDFLDIDWDPFDTIAVSGAVMYQIIFSKYGDSIGDKNSICASIFDSLASATEIPPDSSDYLKVSYSFFGCFDQAFRTITAVPVPYSAFNSPLRSAAKLLLSLHGADAAMEDNVLEVVVCLSAMVRDHIPVIEKMLTQHLPSNQAVLKSTHVPAKSSKPKSVSSYWFLAGAAVLLIGLILFSRSFGGKSTTAPDAIESHVPARVSPSPTSLPSPTPLPSPSQSPTNRLVPVPENGHTLYYATGEPLAPLKVTVPSGNDYYYVVLSSAVTQKRAVSLFVYPGKTVEIDVPLGRYKIFYCCGVSWYGSKLLFGDSGSYCTSDDVLVFDNDGEYYNGYEFTLYPVFDGNWDTREVDYSDFPSA